MAYELYQILGVRPEATADEIRRAYYRKVRNHPPESDPEGFKAIRSAYETLSDPRARQNYDALQEHGDELAELFVEAETAMKGQDWDRAIRLLRRMLALAPGADAARNSLGLCYLNTKQWANAIKAFDWLTQRNPDVPLYWLNLGYTYSEQARSIRPPSSRRARLLNDARGCFRKAVELEKFNSEPYLALARTYSEEENYAEALVWAERAVVADGKADFQDFEALFFACLINLRRGALQEVERTATRIISLLPDDEDMREFVAARFALIGFELYKIKAFRPAVVFLKYAQELDPDSREIRELFKVCGTIVHAADDYNAFMQDPAIIQPFKLLGSFYLAEVFEENIQNRDAVFDNIVRQIAGYPASSVLTSVRRIKHTYPGVYGMNEALFQHIERIASQVQTQATSARGSGGCFVVTATYGTPYAAEVDRYRRFRDEYLLRTASGRALVHVYYALGPSLARIIYMSPGLRRLMAALLGSLAKRLPPKRQ